MISDATACRSRWPCISPDSLARFVFSQSCSRLVRVVSLRLPIIWLTLSLSSASSPDASTVICRVRSPAVTAVATAAIARTCVVRLLASWFTLSVSFCQVPDTPSTSAWPPSRPSVPTSRATRVTSPANEDSWSTIVLIVVLSSRISPRASTSIFFDRSPSATAVVTWAMLRTWLVRLPAMKFTLSVRSFHVPATFGTRAWPPRIPSVPTSRATRVTSSPNARSVSTIPLIVSASARTSPLASTVIFFDRSPFATAVATVAMLRTWPDRLSAMEFTLSVRFFHVPATPGTFAWPPSRPSVPTSRATRVTSSAKEESWSTIVLIVLLSSRISPRASTVIFWLRSPPATAVVTWAMLRTCAVRLSAIEFTLSVNAFHVPATPGTWAWPPSRPSVPTSRATRVTSSAKEESWSTIVFSVVFSSRISPLALTVIFWLRSPCATAVATWAMLRTWLVRLPAMKLTESVRSRHVPATPGTVAWPPSRPSLPTSTATRVTSPAKEESWSTIVFRVLLSSRISPRASTSIFWLRSPRATAVVTWAMLRTWLVRLPAMEFTESVRSRHVPATPGTFAWPPRMPSVPTSRATRVTSPAKEESWSTIVFRVVFSSRISPRASTSIFWLRSPCATAVATWAMLRTWLVRLPAMKFTESVRSRHVPPTPGTWAWPPSRPSVPTSTATRVTSPANEDSWSTIVLRVSFSSSISPATVTVIFCVRSPCATAVATWAMSRTCAVRLPDMKLTESVRSFQMPATPGSSAWPPSRPSVPISRATLVTSPANVRRVAVIELNVSASAARSPRADTVTCCDRSPFATAASTRLSSVVGRIRSSSRPLTASPASAQPPCPSSGASRTSSRPSCPTAWRTRTSSPTSHWLRPAMSLNTSASSAATPLPAGTSRRRKLPSRMSRMATSTRSRAASPVTSVSLSPVVTTASARIGDLPQASHEPVR